jgi:hypothetical protein
MITTALPQSPEVSQLPSGVWTATVDGLSSKWHAHPEDKRTPRPHRPLTKQSRRWAQVLGATPDEVQVYVVRERHTTPGKYGYESIERDVRLVSFKPFVVVRVTEPDEYYDYARYGFVAARQVHGGQLGRKPYLTRLPEVAASSMRDPAIGDHNRTLNWVQLSELAEITGITAADIIRDYAPFSPSTAYESNVPLASGNYKLWTQPDIRRVYTDAELPQGYCGHETAWGGNNAITLDEIADTMWTKGLWVPQSFANRVIRLVSFGYRPGCPLPEALCQIGAPMPAQPQFLLPVLPVEELKELHVLRMELADELPESVFRQAALRALGPALDTTWRKVPELTDPLNGFAYNTDFEQIEQDTDDGQIVIGTCSWTRAGAPKSDNYYAGFLAVFPKGITVTDARRDPRAILRIWLWPGELVREMPIGSKGGLCPPEVPAGCSPMVEHFLLDLGYSL